MGRWYFFLTSAIPLILLSQGCATSQTPPPPLEGPPIEEPSQPEQEVIEEFPKEEPPEPEPETFSVSQEVYNEAFEDIGVLISKLNAIIRSKNFRLWKTNLTLEYINTYGNPEKLLELSEQPMLKRRGIRLKSLQDYFFHVVVPSRSRVKLDDILFLDNFRVKAIMYLNGKRSLLYLLEKKNGIWKIGT